MLFHHLLYMLFYILQKMYLNKSCIFFKALLKDKTSCSYINSASVTPTSKTSYSCHVGRKLNNAMLLWPLMAVVSKAMRWGVEGPGTRA
jgi:hypothetical protein